jgi:hypothetical protein
MKVLFTGAQGTGKTSVMEALPASWPKIKGVTRKTIAENNLAINQNSTDYSQRAIFDAYSDVLSVDKDFISERSLFDVLAFTQYQFCQGKVSEKLFLEQLKRTKKFVQENPDALYIYFPVEFDPQNDGQRSTDPEYQHAIDAFIRMFIGIFPIKYIIVSGSVSERCRQIQSVVNFD